MNHDKHIRPIGGHIQRQHQQMQHLVRKIGHLLSNLPTETALCQSLREVNQLLTELRQHLAMHFAHEDEGGYLEEAAGRVPRLATTVAMLEKQHPELLRELDRIMAISQTAPTTYSRWRRIGDEFGHFACTLLKHEDIENQILQKGFNDDLGLERENPLAKDAI